MNANATLFIHKKVTSVFELDRFFLTGTPPKSSKYKKVILARLGVSWPIYVNVDSPNLGFPYFNFLEGYQYIGIVYMHIDHDVFAINGT